MNTFKEWCQEGYKTIQHWDEIYSNWFCIPRSIKTTSIKPSGTVSILAGATPGMHWPESQYYIRRVRLDSKSELIQPLINAGYSIETSGQWEPEKDEKGNDKLDKDGNIINKIILTPGTSVVAIPIDSGNLRTQHEVSMWEQAEMAAFLNEYWSDNQVSCTITFDPVTEGPQIKHLLNYYQYRLKGVSFLPRLKKGAYYQLPYETINEETYNTMMSTLRPVSFRNTHVNSNDAMQDRFCDGDKCIIISVGTDNKDVKDIPIDLNQTVLSAAN